MRRQKSASVNKAGAFELELNASASGLMSPGVCGGQ